ncbi:unnamed protein product [Microthlaspi erraticum]|uniref:Uncharacterized protein n=1 Tax=Microthlaspi erraticum TaxID=1685480 RepID=A0A6D2IJM4_9BRAS|nr:unnamed protein product [Microthlaspi erraticum]
MATTSLFFMSTNQNSSVGNPNELLRNTHLVNFSGEIRTEPPQKSRGRKPGSKTGQQNQKKPKLRGMGIARLERAIEEEEKKNMVVAGGRDVISAAPDTKATRSPAPDPVVVLQGFPSYGGPTAPLVGGCTRSRLYCGGVGSGQIMIDPVGCPWGFAETTTHELSSIPNPQTYHASNHRCETCFKKKRLDGDDHNVVRSNGGGFSKYAVIPPPTNGYDRFLQPDQRSHGFFYDQRIARSAPPPAFTNPYFNDATNHTVRY